jgi:vitamin B12 transporter
VDVSRNGTLSGLHASGYPLLNLAGSYDLGNGVSAYARIDNLFDRRYQDPTGFLRPGLGVFAGVRLALAAPGLGR